MLESRLLSSNAFPDQSAQYQRPPSLFEIYIDDLPDAVEHSSTRLFADDSLLYRKIRDQQEQALLQEDLDSLKEWEHTWQIEFNPSKCSVILIMPNEQRKVLTSSYLLHRQTLETTSASKYLGITIRSDLSWSTHVQDVAAQGNWTAGFLQRNFRECTPKLEVSDLHHNGTPYIGDPQWGAADAEIKVPSGENTELKPSPFQAWSRSVYSHTCYAYCQGNIWLYVHRNH